METIKKVFRWIAILPGAIIALIVSFAIIKLFMGLLNWFIGVSSDSPYMKLMEIIISGVSGYYFVYIGSKIAPSNKKAVAHILTGIILILGGMIVFFDIQQGNYYNAVASGATAVGGMILLYSINSGDLDLDEPIFG